jgi:hypothetical protein
MEMIARVPAPANLRAVVPLTDLLEPPTEERVRTAIDRILSK